MFGYLRQVYQRHKKKLVIATGVAAFSYLISIYVRHKLKDFQEQLKEENATRELIKKRFTQTQKDCYMTFLSFLPVLIEPIYKELDVEQITKELKLIRKNKNTSLDDKSELSSSDITSSSNLNRIKERMGEGQTKSNARKNKVELWQDLKHKSITRFLTIIYSETLLIILLHLQLNIISRKSYLKTALKLASNNQGIKLIDLEKNMDSPEMDIDDTDEDLPEQAFLSFTWWLLNKGSMELKSIITESVESTFSGVSLRQELSIEEFDNLILQVQKDVDSRILEGSCLTEGGERFGLENLLLPSPEDEFTLLQNTNTVKFISSFNANVSNAQILQKMNSELKGYLRGSQVAQLIRVISSLGISNILDRVHDGLLHKNVSTDDAKGVSDLQESADERNKDTPKREDSWKLALILATLTPQTKELTNRHVDNSILYTMNNVSGLDDLSASVYSNFDL
ncbi:hypothetical protein JL09_g152 [Pichia kudriavzevii]|uniref:Peroxin-3 n=1 Tax=Pichia kudriavzevii TaxID=4909 RepID=A0A099P8U8_PICKU|nr:hypothetical protein JL09_g152 [Pichia kudriavzevii]